MNSNGNIRKISWLVTDSYGCERMMSSCRESFIMFSTTSFWMFIINIVNRFVCSEYFNTHTHTHTHRPSSK